MRGTRPHVRDRLGEALTAGEELVISVIAVEELVLGAHLSARPKLQLATLTRVLMDFRAEAWTLEDALVTGELRAEHERLGRRLPSYDTLIAGQALARGWTIVTGNVRDFREVKGLAIIDWSDPAGPIEVSAAKTSVRRRPPED